MSIHERLGNFPEDHTFIQLANKSSNCYINSVLQSLFNIPTIEQFLVFTDLFLKKKNLKEVNEESLFGLFVKIYIDSINAGRNEVYYEPNNFLDEVYRSLRNFVRNEKGDSYEFFLHLVASFDNSINFVNNIIAESQNNDEKKDNDNGITIFSSMFKITLDKIYGQRHNHESFNIISIFPNPEGVLKAITEWKDSKSNPFGSVEYLDMPLVLSIKIDHLVLGYNQAPTKSFVKTPIPIGFTLKNAKKREFEYEFAAAVIHLGNDDDGHYICVFRACNRFLVGDDTEIWGLNDQQIEGFINRNEIPGQEICSTISMLFYQKK